MTAPEKGGILQDRKMAENAPLENDCPGKWVILVILSLFGEFGVSFELSGPEHLGYGQKPKP